MGAQFMTDAYVAPSTDPLDVLANLANEASARMERAEAALKEALETIEALKQQLATRCEIHEAAVEKAQAQRDELLAACHALMGVGSISWERAMRMAELAVVNARAGR